MPRQDIDDLRDEKPKKAFPATKRANKSLSRDVEVIDLDLTPFMNIFMVLIPFLAVMAVFTRVAILEFSLPPAQSEGAAAAAAAGQQNKELDVSIVITDEGYRIVGTGKKLDIVPKIRGQYQLEQLRTLLKAIKFEYPSQKSLVLVLAPEVLYDDVIHFMDVCRESQFPDIGLSGEIR
jgi:biopolymer transport protein ExbD